MVLNFRVYKWPFNLIVLFFGILEILLDILKHQTLDNCKGLSDFYDFTMKIEILK